MAEAWQSALSIEDLRGLARRRLPRFVFERIELLPKVLVDVSAHCAADRAAGSTRDRALRRRLHGVLRAGMAAMLQTDAGLLG